MYYYVDTDELPGSFPFTKKSYLHRAQWRIFKILFLSFTCGDIGVATVTNMVFLFFVRILTFWNRKYKYYCLYFSFITLHLRFITFLWQVFCDRWPLNCTILLFRKWIQWKRCVLCSTNINHKGLQRTANKYTEERRVYKDLISKNNNVDMLNSASRILQCWSYYVKINSARHQHDTERTQNRAGL